MTLSFTSSIKKDWRLEAIWNAFKHGSKISQIFKNRQNEL